MLVIRGGRLIDPASGFDAIGDVHVDGTRVVAVGAGLPEPDGATVIDARGLVVGPGFVDVHSHAVDLDGQRLQVRDGVTTALELEGGRTPVARAYESFAAEGRLINYGFAAGWGSARAEVLLGRPADATFASAMAVLGEPGWQRTSTASERRAWLGILERELADGALGIGILIGYAPRTEPEELLAAARLAAAAGAPAYAHIRNLVEDDPDTPIDGADELVQAAAETGAHLHHCHLNSTARRRIPRVLAAYARARDEGLPVSAEAYPYGAGSTAIGAAFLSPEGLAAWGLGPQNLVLAGSGERIGDAARLRELRAATPEAPCFVEFLDERDPADRALLEAPLRHPGVLVASDAVPGGVHPRTAGTFAKALRWMVRETGAWTWVEAFRRCAHEPARLLAGIAPAAGGKGWLGPGADADLVVLDPATVGDRATVTATTLPSEGIRHVLVGGEPVVRDGELRDVRPGRPLRGAPR